MNNETETPRLHTGIAPPETEDGTEYILKSARRNGSEVEIPVYDDAYGKVYIHRNSIGICGIAAMSHPDGKDWAICDDCDSSSAEELERIYMEVTE
jgi:hypothetical protein